MIMVHAAGPGEPLVRLVKRSDISRGRAWLIRISAIFFALCAGGFLILALGYNPAAVYAVMVKGSLSTRTALAATIKIAIPLLGTSLAIAPAFKMKFWNIGAEGQIMAGAIAATYFALFQYENMSRSALLTVMCVAAMAAGGLWSVIPAVFKARWGTNETLFTLMLNYVAFGIVKYLRMGPWKSPTSAGFPKIDMFDGAARLPAVFGVNIGWIIVLALTAAMFVYMKYTKQGYEISVVGESVRTAKYIGMNVPKVIIRTIFVSGAIAGLMGYLIVSGSSYTLNDGTRGDTASPRLPSRGSPSSTPFR
jgi:simple sugar transport system permease protein